MVARDRVVRPRPTITLPHVGAALDLSTVDKSKPAKSANTKRIEVDAIAALIAHLRRLDRRRR